MLGRVFPNCTARGAGERQQLVGPQLDDSAGISGLLVRRPIERGYLVNPDLQSDIWAHVLRSKLRVRAGDCGLVLAEPLLNLPNIQEATHQVPGRMGCDCCQPARYHPQHAADCALAISCTAHADDF